MTAQEGKIAEGGTAGVIAPPPLVYLAGLAAGFGLERWHPFPFLSPQLARPVGLALLLAGLILIPAVRAMRRAGTRPEPWQPTRALVTDGPYRFTRNPMYLGFTLIYLGVVASLNSGWMLALLPLVILTMLLGVIHREERYLEARFGEPYREYCRRVRRWL